LAEIRVEVRPLPLKFYAGSIALAIVSVVVLAFGGWLVSRPKDREPGTVFLVIGAVLGVAPVVNFSRRARRRMTLEADAQGLTVTRTGGDPERHAYDEVEWVTLDEKEKLDNGEPVGWMRRLAVRATSGTLAVEAFSGVGRADDMALFLALVLEGCADAAEARLKRGLEIRGRGWALNHAGFRAPGMTAPVPLGAIAKADRFQGHVALWRRGEDRPFFAVAEGTENARTLIALVSRAAADQPLEPLGSGQLGRVLFEKTSLDVRGIAYLVLGALMAFAGYMVKDLLLPFAAFLGAGGVGLAGFGFWTLTRSIRIHEGGIVSRSLLGERVLFYRDVARFAYGTTRHYVKGSYAGTQLAMKLVPEGGGPPIRFSTAMRGSDADLDALRDHIAQTVAERLYPVVEGGGEVAWGKDARITLREVHGRRSTFLGKRRATVAIGPDMQERFHEGRFFLSLPGSKKPLLDLGCGEENFYPGHVVLGWLVEEAGEEDEEPATC
jgi:hypothetical protein